MAARELGISYTDSGSTAYNFVIDNFGSNALPRTYTGSMTYDMSANGANILGGPAYSQKYQWVVSTLMPQADAVNFDVMFQAWDADRAAGLTAACGITDETWGATVNTNAVFVTPPSYTYMSPSLTMVSFGLQEV